MWQCYSCPRCGYAVNAGDRYCGNCGINLTTDTLSGHGYREVRIHLDQNTREVINRNISAYKKLYRTGNKNTEVPNSNSTTAETGRANETPIRSEIIKLLSGLLNN